MGARAQRHAGGIGQAAVMHTAPPSAEQLRLAFRHVSRPGWPSTLEAALAQPAYRVCLYGIARNLHRRGIERAVAAGAQQPSLFTEPV